MDTQHDTTQKNINRIPNAINCSPQREYIFTKDEYKAQFVEDEILFITTPIAHLLLTTQHKEASDLMWLYIFYYRVTKESFTDKETLTIKDTAKLLHWSVAKTIKLTEKLIELGLIEIVDHNVKIYYVFSPEIMENITFVEEN